MAAKLGFEAIKYVLTKVLTKKGIKGIATIPGKAYAMRMKQLVDEMATKMRALGYDINKVTEKQVQGLLDSTAAMEKQKVKKAQVLRDKAKKEYDYVTSEKYIEDLWNKSPAEIRELLRKQGLTPVEDRGIKSLGKKKTPIVKDPTKEIIDWDRDPFRGFTPKIVPKETEAEILARMKGMNKKTVERIKRRRYEAAIKAEKAKAAKDPNYIPDVIDPEDFASGGIARVGFFKGKLAKGFFEFVEGLFIKASNDIRLGKGQFKNLTDKQKWAQHDNLTKMVAQFQKTKKLPEGAEQYFGVDAEKAFKAAQTKVKEKSIFSMTKEEKAARLKKYQEETGIKLSYGDKDKRLIPDIPGVTEESLDLAILKGNFERKYTGVIDDRLMKQVLADNDPQRISEVMATIDQSLAMQKKGMGTQTIMDTLKESFTRKKQASGGLIPGYATGGVSNLFRSR